MSSHGQKMTAEAARLQDALTDSAAHTPAATALVINAGAAEFFGKLAKVLIAVCLELEGKNLCGRFSDFSDPQVEIRYRVSLARPGIFPQTTQIDIFHAFGSQLMRFITLEGVAFHLRLGVQPGTTEVALVSESGMTFMGPEKAAWFIVEPMIRRLRSKG